MKIISVVGARPNFMKIAAIHDAIENHNSRNNNKILHLICHTGQHYDETMSKIFFNDLELPKPDFYLGIGSGSHAEQTARIMIEFEKILINEKPDLVIVVGDVNSTIACSLTAVKLGIKIAHVEAGLRSYDRTMPEEINRILTDMISDYLFVTEKSGYNNLIKEGISKEKIYFVGNVMIDTLLKYLSKTRKMNVSYKYKIENKKYCTVTLHRPSNVDNKNNLYKLIEMLNKVALEIKIIFPIHPRTRKNLIEYGLDRELNKNVILENPVGYLEFINLLENSLFVLTDSGGIQEETTFLNVPCITLRNSTERPVTVEVGTNYLVGENLEKAWEYIQIVLNGKAKSGVIPELWDGKSSERIIDIVANKFDLN